MAGVTTWVRQATGVVRGVNPWTMFWANMGEIGFGGGFLFLNIIFASFISSIPGGSNPSELVPAVGLFTVAVMFEAYIFYHITHTVARTSGDYVWLSRTISPSWAGFLMLGFVFTGIPFIAVDLFFMFSTMAPSFTILGQVTNNPALTSGATALNFYGGSFNAPEAIAIGVLIIAIITAIDIVRPSLGFKVLAGFVALGTLAALAMAILFLASGPSGVQSSLNSYMGTYGLYYFNGTGYSAASNMTTLSTNPFLGGGTPSFTWFGVFLLLPFVGIYMPWINNVAAFGGELKSIKKSAMYATLLAALVSGVLLMVFSQLYISYVGGSAITYGLSQTSSTMLGVATMVAGNNPVLGWFMNLGFSLWFLASIAQTILVISRYLLGMGFDRFIPTWFASVNDRFHSPINGLVFPAVISAIITAFVMYYSFISAFTTTALGTLYFAGIGLTVIIYAYRKRADLKMTASALILSGVVVLIFFAVLTVEFFAYPYFGVSLNNLGAAIATGVSYTTPTGVAQPYGGLPWLIIIFGFWIVGALWFSYRKWYYKGKGIDLSATYREIPP
ncbi:MAG TPA: amino acid permease, partial [Nitrososphaerales archaeon]|nr:amino acid permease [Nitrososphaerales archaeon]